MNAQLLIYDSDCPFCKWYSGLFIRTGFLAPEGRIPYNQAIEDSSIRFNHDHGRNQIALVDRATGVTHYGINSLLEVLGTRLPLIRTIGQLPVIHQLLQLLYTFISFNRKVIAPSDCKNTCVPSRSIAWRITFIIVCGLIVNAVTALYFNQQLGAFYKAGPNADILFFTVQLAFQGLAFYLLKQKDFYNYAGQVAFVSLLGALVLLGFHLGLNLLTTLGMDVDLLQPICYGVVLMFMFYEHSRRIKLLHLSPLLTLSWVIFRLVIYPFAFNL